MRCPYCGFRMDKVKYSKELARLLEIDCKIYRCIYCGAEAKITKGYK